MRWRALDGPEAGVVATQSREFEQVVLPCLDSAYNLARWLVGDPTLAEDVVQDAVIRALGYFATYRGGDARAWLLRIVRNTAYTTLAARKRRATTSLDAAEPDEEPPALRVADTAPDPEATLSQHEDHAAIGAALARLPDDLRECLVLRELEELSYKQIAHVTGVPVGTVMSRLWRARRALAPVAAQGDTA